MTDKLYLNASEEVSRVQRFSVAKSNEFIYRSLYDLSLMEQRILLCMISTIDSRPSDLKFDSNEQLLYEFNIDTFCNLFNIKKRGALKLISEAAKGLRDHSFWMENEDGKYETMAWADKAWVDTKKGVITLLFSPDVKPFLMNLDKNFTHYELYRVLKFKSKHSIIVYDLIKASCGKSYGKKGCYQITVEDFKKHVSIRVNKKTQKPVYQNTDFSDLRVRVLEPAIEEINKYTDLTVEVEYIKKGKSVVMISFTYTKSDF